MKRRILALLLIAAALLSCLAGCSKEENQTDPQSTDTQTKDSSKPNANVKHMDAEAVTSKYAYKAEYLDLPIDVDYIGSSCLSGDSLFFTANVVSGKETYTDDMTGESYEYDTYEDKLFRMDLTTRECAELTGLKNAEIPEGWQGDSYIQSMTAGLDGSVWLFRQTNTYRFNDPTADADTPAEDIDGNYDYYESGEEIDELIHVGADGTILQTISAGAEDTSSSASSEAAMGGFYVNNIYADSNGYIYASDWQSVRVWDKDGNLVMTLNMDNGGDLMQYSADKIGVLVYGETRGIKLIDPVKKDWGETIELPSLAYNIFPGDDTYDFFYDYNGKIYGYIAETKTAEKVVDWMECDVDSNNMSSYSILPDGRVIAITQDYRSDTNRVQIILLTRVDASTLPEKKTLTLACMYLDYNLRSQIVKFNQQNQEYRIAVKDYSEYATEDDYQAGLTKLTTEIGSGAMPDLLITNSLPVQQYAAKGMLVDLWTMIDNDADLSRDDLISEVLDALSIDGALYQLPMSFMLDTVAGLEKVVGEYETWTLADVQDAMTKLQPDATIFSGPYTKSNALSSCVSASFDDFVDWETGTCSFDGEEFKELLEFANQFPAEFDYEKSDYYDNYESDYKRMRSGKQLLTILNIYSFDDLYVQFKALDDQPCFVGYPTAASGTRVRSTFSFDAAIAVTAACTDVDAAWSFLRSVLSEEYQSQMWNFPILKSAFDAKLADAMKQEFYTDENGNQVEQSKGGIGWGNDEMYEIYAVTPEQRDIFMDLLQSTTKVSSYDQDIMDIVTEETGAYFAGQKTVDETVKIIQNRVNLYVAEQS